MTIGICDSGVGGLTVLRAIRRAFPAETLLYFGDTARVPYGNKSRETVVRYTLESARFLSERGVDAIVVACNTSSAVALAAVAAAVPVPVLGVIEPGVRAALERSFVPSNGGAGRRIGVIATTATVASEAYAAAIKAMDPTAQVISRACPLFVPLVEEGWLDTPVTTMVAEEYLAPLRAERIDTLILGCTHYPLLAPVIARVLGPSIPLVESGAAVASALAALLGPRAAPSAPSGRNPVQIYVTDCSPQFVGLAHRLLEGEDPHLTTVAL